MSVTTDEVCGAKSGQEVKVVYKLCDLSAQMADAWKCSFQDYIPDHVQVYKGDIFKEGPAADAIVSPANSFGFMDGGIDMVYSKHFGWQLQTRLQEMIRTDKSGELLVGECLILPTMEKHNKNSIDWSKYNEGKPIPYLISAPTMRVPMDVDGTANAYLAFRGIILAGLGTAVGRMPADRCAFQMLQAFERFELGLQSKQLKPDYLSVSLMDHYAMYTYQKEKEAEQPRTTSEGTEVESKIQQIKVSSTEKPRDGQEAQ